MNAAETIKIMAVLRGAYPQFYRGVDREEAEDTVNLWQDLFAGYDYPLVAAAVKSYIEADEKGYPPAPGQIAGKIRLMTGGSEQTEAEAWALVAAAIQNGLYGAREEFQRLPETCRRLVGSPEQLRSWAMLDSSTVHGVVASNFQRSYRAAAAREAEIAKLPADVRQLLSGLGERPRLGEGRPALTRDADGGRTG